LLPPPSAHNHEFSGGGVGGLAHGKPPASDRRHREACGVVIGADADPRIVVRYIVDAIRIGPSQFLVDEVMHFDLLGIPLRPPVAAAVLVLANQFLLFCIHRDHRLGCIQGGLGPVVDVFKLGVAVRMARAFQCLAVSLQTVAHLFKQDADTDVADGMPLPGQLTGQVLQTLAGPAQCRHRIASGCRFHQDAPARLAGPGPDPPVFCARHPAIEQRWYTSTALDDLLEIEEGRINDTRLYRCLDRILLQQDEAGTAPEGTLRRVVRSRVRRAALRPDEHLWHRKIIT